MPTTHCDVFLQEKVKLLNMLHQARNFVYVCVCVLLGTVYFSVYDESI